MKTAYPAFIAEDKTDKSFGVCVPGLDIYTDGEDFCDAIYMARDAIGLMIVSMEDDGDAIPEPSDCEAAREKVDTEFFDYLSGVCTFVDVDVDAYRRSFNKKTIRKNVSLPEWLDIEAKKAKINVSKVLQDALIAELGLEPT